MKPGHIIMLVLGILLSLTGFALAASSAFLGVVQSAQDEDGYLVSDRVRFTAPTHALVSEPLEVVLDEALPPGMRSDNFSVMLRAAAVPRDQEIFIGIAQTAQVDAYLADVAHSQLDDVGFAPFEPDYREVPGTATPAPPGDQAFWAVSASGPGEQRITWDLQSGDWTVVVMNNDGGAPVSADLAAGLRLGFLGPLAIGLLIAGLVLLIIGLPLLLLGAAGLGRHLPPGPANRGTDRPAYPDHPPAYPYRAPANSTSDAYPGNAPPAGASPASAPPPGNPTDGKPYPALLYGQLDPGLSRWLWLVKWLLAIPHYILLFFLWFAFGIVTIAAGFAILFTGRYPHSLFKFNVGVVRWNWRVAFYAYGALGTDRYPPFTLAPAAYPAEFDVAYPHRLSRGLVLVKWWLLAIPHYLVVAILTGSAYTWWAMDDDWDSYTRVSTPSLLGLLVFIAAVILLFTARYPRGLFNLVLGINRWVYRVTAYAALMRDDYPPFRLDQGPAEPLPMSGQPTPDQAPGPATGAGPATSR
ncbi:hypothetical protein D477_011076 [Arthrobacter crystallopoietes BAB-32]|uniref:DUF4389 domain-containing protein n=2 Tax=Crystallibacter crystallopoietes TaxID=37928 RepID=N1UYL4_9MICC|nr:hypothetical protein D477_011076 [Arthrobacter crystallopoietes BAB-32]